MEATFIFSLLVTVAFFGLLALGEYYESWRQRRNREYLRQQRQSASETQ